MKSLLIPLLLLGTLSSHAQQADRDAAPEETVDRLETVLIENMKAGESLTFDERFEKLRPLVEDIMAVERMGRYLFGRDWASFGEPQRERFKSAFLDLSAATYAGQFKDFGGERFDPVEVQRQDEDRAVVKRRLTTGSGKKVAFDYLMTHSDDGWQIVTIITDGVSDLAVKRTQYQRLLEDQDFEAVISRIQDSAESQRSD
ncbi:MAG: ABC transporter substrate-binding protein [Wenzhouxiangellaceae bacterium]|nr:ABC transporter substrate-binding protein [Wenzhouxiangellaceae bacterium]MBS3822757.1 ABC transporter substrate-binding protein [Wenzhouxiangellaceae bacterium]